MLEANLQNERAEGSSSTSGAYCPPPTGVVPMSAVGPSSLDEQSSPQAIVVIHGIGQQPPFEPLDSFVNGLRALLERPDSGVDVELTHRMFGREKVFDHCIRIKATETGGGPRTILLDVYEFYWASLTQGSASFTQIVRWLVSIGLTPLRRFAYNFPMLLSRAEDRALGPGGASSDRMPDAASLRERLSRPRVLLHLCREFIHEIWRVVYVALIAVAFAAFGVLLVDRIPGLVEQLKQLPTLAGSLAKHEELITWPVAAWTAVGLIAAIWAVALGWSMAAQSVDLFRLLKNRRRDVLELRQALQHGLTSGEKNSFLSRVRAAGARWQTEIWARIWFLIFSILGLALAAWIIQRVHSPDLLCLWQICVAPSPILQNLLSKLESWEMLVVVGLLAIAFKLKQIFVDYLGDVALYTSADENSAYFATRTKILEEATRRVRFLLQDPQYHRVAIAGHSLGSVIGYDVISRLRTEARLYRGGGVQATVNGLWNLAQKLALRDPAAGAELISQIKGYAEARDTAGATSVSPAEFAKLATFITFGSPLNKVFYFFRTKIKANESVRGQIVQELYGFRQRVGFALQETREIREETQPPDDNLYWMNVYSPMDPVSAPLWLYRGVENYSRWFLLPGWCHTHYWHDPKFFKLVLAALKKPGSIDSVNAAASSAASTLANAAD